MLDWLGFVFSVITFFAGLHLGNRNARQSILRDFVRQNAASLRDRVEKVCSLATNLFSSDLSGNHKGYAENEILLQLQFMNRDCQSLSMLGRRDPLRIRSDIESYALNLKEEITRDPFKGTPDPSWDKSKTLKRIADASESLYRCLQGYERRAT